MSGEFVRHRAAAVLRHSVGIWVLICYLLKNPLTRIMIRPAWAMAVLRGLGQSRAKGPNLLPGSRIYLAICRGGPDLMVATGGARGRNSASIGSSGSEGDDPAQIGLEGADL